MSLTRGVARETLIKSVYFEGDGLQAVHIRPK